MPDARPRRVRARVTVTVEGNLSDVPAEDVRAVLARSIRTNGGYERVQLIEVGDVRLLGDAGAGAPTTSAPDTFYESLSPEALAARQGVGSVADFDQLLGDFWPADESADDVIRAVKSWCLDEG